MDRWMNEWEETKKGKKERRMENKYTDMDGHTV